MDRGSKIVNYFYKVINVLLEPLTNNSIEGYPVVTEEIVDSDFGKFDVLFIKLNDEFI